MIPARGRAHNLCHWQKVTRLPIFRLLVRNLPLQNQKLVGLCLILAFFLAGGTIFPCVTHLDEIGNFGTNTGWPGHPAPNPFRGVRGGNAINRALYSGLMHRTRAPAAQKRLEIGHH